jgi:hypothetical protein
LGMLPRWLQCWWMGRLASVLPTGGRRRRERPPAGTSQGPAGALAGRASGVCLVTLTPSPSRMLPA